jgi:hypothetical protein
MTDKSDWNAMYYVALGGDGHIHAPDDGWPEGVTIALTDAPYAALTCHDVRCHLSALDSRHCSVRFQ